MSLLKPPKNYRINVEEPQEENPKVLCRLNALELHSSATENRVSYPAFMTPIIPTVDVVSAPAPATPSAAPKVHFQFLDGIRALAALYVTVGHCSVNIQYNVTNGALHLSGLLNKIQFFLFFIVFRFGHYAVDVFIVLSGFCLMLPVARAGGNVLPKGTADYFKRRSRRILPPYYAALALSLLLTASVPALRHSKGYWGETLPSFSFGAVVSHLFLVHNLTPYLWKINTPLWSIAVEWQIYFLFPLFLFVKRRWGIGWTLLLGFVLGLAPHFLIGPATDKTYPWYIGLFVFGMLASEVCFHRKTDAYLAVREKFPFLSVFWFLSSLIVVLSTLENKRFERISLLQPLRHYVLGYEWNLDILVGLAAVCLLVYCVEQGSKESAQHPLLLRILRLPALVKIGTFSYSLYLIHSLVLALMDGINKALHLSPSLVFVTLYIFTLPLCVLFAYGFHVCFERPFMSSKPKLRAS